MAAHRWIQIATLFACVVACFVPALGAAFFPVDSWYAGLDKPSWTPPGWLFGPVWSLLYLAMGVSLWLLLKPIVGRSERARPGRLAALAAFSLQWALNAAWTPIFFGLHEIGWALLVIVLLWLAIAATIATTWSLCEPAALLLSPYLAWVTFATALNAAIWRLNA